MLWVRVLALMAVCGANAQASTIVMTLTGPADITLGSTSLLHSQFTITEVADTDNRQVWASGRGYYLNDSSASISIPGLGEFTFLTPTISLVDRVYGEALFYSGSLLSAAHLHGPNTLSFAPWDMLTSLAPTSGRGSIDSWNLYPAMTSGGLLVLTQDQSIPGFTFSAVVIPEPATPILLTSGAALFFLLRKRRAA